MTLAPYAGGKDPLDFTPALFLAMLDRVDLVQRRQQGRITLEEAMGQSFTDDLGPDWSFRRGL